MKKPIINTPLYRKADRYEPHRCVVEKAVAIPHTASIRYHVFPKKIKNGQADQKNTVLFNFSERVTEVTELQYFIDMDIRGHILGVVWLMLIGYRIDQNCIYEHSYGNRISMRMKMA